MTEQRPLFKIAREIRASWGSKVSIHAEPYLAAMSRLNNVKDMYYLDTAESVVAYFLSNAQSWRGEDARRIKKELNSMLKEKTDA